MKRIRNSVVLVLTVLLLASCSFPGLASNTDEDTISITGGITSEAQIIASIVALGWLNTIRKKIRRSSIT